MNELDVLNCCLCGHPIGAGDAPVTLSTAPNNDPCAHFLCAADLEYEMARERAAFDAEVLRQEGIAEWEQHHPVPEEQP